MQGQVGELRKEHRALPGARGRRRAGRREAERPARARGARSRSCVHDAHRRDRRRRSGDAAAPHGRRATAEGGGKKGDTVVEIGAGDRRAARPRSSSRPRTSALARTTAWAELNACMGQRDAGFARPRGRRRGQGPGRARGADRVPGQQDDRRVLDREEPDPAGPAARLPLRCARGCMARERRPARGRRRRRPRRGRGGGGAAQARQPSPQVADQHHQQRDKAAGDGVRRDGRRRRALLARIEGLVAAAAEDARPSWARARAAAGRSASSCARGRR